MHAEAEPISIIYAQGAVKNFNNRTKSHRQYLYEVTPVEVRDLLQPLPPERSAEVSTGEEIFESKPEGTAYADGTVAVLEKEVVRIDQTIDNLRKSLQTTELQKEFDLYLAARNRSMASHIGHVHKNGVKILAVDENNKIVINHPDVNSEYGYLNGYQLSKRTVSKWKKEQKEDDASENPRTRVIFINTVETPEEVLASTLKPHVLSVDSFNNTNGHHPNGKGSNGYYESGSGDGLGDILAETVRVHTHPVNRFSTLPSLNGNGTSPSLEKQEISLSSSVFAEDPIPLVPWFEDAIKGKEQPFSVEDRPSKLDEFRAEVIPEKKREQIWRSFREAVGNIGTRGKDFLQDVNFVWTELIKPNILVGSLVTTLATVYVYVTNSGFIKASDFLEKAWISFNDYIMLFSSY